MAMHDIVNTSLTAVLIGLALYNYNNMSENYTSPTTKPLIKFWDQLYDETNSLDAKKYNFLLERDYKTVYDPLSPPEQRVESQQYPYGQVLFNKRTRGEPDNYQLVGLLYNQNKNKNYQIYGRHTYPGSYEWEYYLRAYDVGGLEVKLPLAGKQELMDGTTMNIPYDDVPYNVSIYNYNMPRYNPFVY
jgi:hypothetical protein